MLNGGHKQFLGSFYVVASSFSHIEGGAPKVSTLLKGGRNKFYPVLRGGGAQKVSDSRFSRFAAPPPLPVINDQSLKMRKKTCLM